MEGHDAYSKSLGDVLDLVPRTRDIFSESVNEIFNSCLSLSLNQDSNSDERANYDALRLLSRFINRKSMWLRKQNLNKFLSYGFPKEVQVKEPSNCTEAELVHIKRQNKLASEARDNVLGNLVDAALARLEMLGLIEYMWKEKDKTDIDLDPEDTIALIATTFTLDAEVKKLANKFGVITRQLGNSKGDFCWPFERKL